MERSDDKKNIPSDWQLGDSSKRIIPPSYIINNPSTRHFDLRPFTALASLAPSIAAFSFSLGLPPNALHDRFGEFERRQSLIKYIHYPPTPNGGQGVGLHQDSLFLTLLLPGTEVGLEVQLPDGTFVEVGRKNDAEGKTAFVVNLGEVMQQMTGGYFLATPHRVHVKADRYSIGFFYGPTLESTLNPPLTLPKRLAAAVAASARHRSPGASPTPEELARGVTGSFEGNSKHNTYGDLLWNYFGRSHPKYVAIHYGSPK